MPNRKTRDQIITEALDMTDSPTLDQKERPNGVDITGTLSTRWLQNFVDLFHTKFPLSVGLGCATISLAAGAPQYAFPLDFIQIYRNGMHFIGESGRIYQSSLDDAIKHNGRFPSGMGKPERFVILGPGHFRVFPIPDRVYQVEIWYYALPAPLGPSDICPFPPDHVLIECLHLRQREWLQMVPQNSAWAYAHSAIAELQKSGISNEPEPTTIDLDENTFRTTGDMSGPGWMGDTVPR